MYITTPLKNRLYTTSALKTDCTPHHYLNQTTPHHNLKRDCTQHFYILTLEELHDRICREVDILRNFPVIIRIAVGGLVQRCRLCLDRGGCMLKSVGV